MEPIPWRERVRQEDVLLEQLEGLVADSAKRRAEALREGVAELGSVYAVSKDLGKSWTAIDKAIKKQDKKNRPAGTGPATTE
ncbi:hypothetical protein ACH4TQ_46860 [Streptomyces sp. NPDC021218]|uniref:hypothetical protein n=1 Tax=Streptomyces sp. NPDC021218 TaxID=3365119 RepID=UPI0037ADA823